MIAPSPLNPSPSLAGGRAPPPKSLIAIFPSHPSTPGRLNDVAAATSSPDSLQFHLVVSSRFENIEIVQVVLNDSLERIGLTDDDRHWIDLAVREAVANAIKHGSQGSADKRVEVELYWDDGVVKVRIEDEGPGFDPRLVDDPRSPENLLRPNGRGIFYIESFMDQVDWETSPSGGTVVTLTKRVAVPLAEPSVPPGANGAATGSRTA